MKNPLLFILILIVSSYSCQTDSKDSDNDPSNEYRDITESFSLQEFESVKSFILDKGDRQTYCAMYIDNPHYAFNEFEAYLNPEIGQKNLYCDASISDFNQIVIRDQNADPQYYYILIVKSGDLDNEDIFFTIPDWAEENKIYLLNNHDYNIDQMMENLNGYIESMKIKI